MVLKRPCLNENKNTCKELSQNKACSLDIGTQYWTDLNGIALKNNRLNVAVGNIRHWGLVLICILYTAWQRGVFAAFLIQRTMTTWLHFVWAQSYTAKIFVYTKVRALAKYNLFQPVNHRVQSLCDSRFDWFQYVLFRDCEYIKCVSSRLLCTLSLQQQWCDWQW